MSAEQHPPVIANLAQLPTRPLLVVCDNPRDIADFKKHLSLDYRLHFAHTQAQALAYLERYKPAVALVDLALGRGTSSDPEGFLTMAELLRYAPALKIIVVTENTQRADAVRSVGAGAYDFYHKPIESQILRVITNRAYRWDELEQENRSLALQVQQTPDSGIIGTCTAMQQVHKAIDTLAICDTPILITGAPGTGKKLVAKALHHLGPRQAQRFVVIDCTSRPERAFADELPSLWNDDSRPKKSRKNTAADTSGNTLFLEEVGQLSLALQHRLLDYLNACKANESYDLRIICSTTTDLTERVRQQSFNKELFAILDAARLELPTLRERGDDRLLLARSFLHKFNADYHQSRQGFTTEAIDAILQHPWAGNVQELTQRVKRAVLMANTSLITAEDMELGLPIDHATPPRTLQEARRAAELQAVQHALKVSNGNISNAAKILAVSRPTLYDLLKRHGIRAVD